jgi:L-iditol 2-dehydrogenase
MVELGRMECEEALVPTIGGGEVLVRSEMASICGSDLHIVEMGGGLPVRLPMPHGYPGHEGIGEVVESNDPAVAVGSHVLCFPNTIVGECFSEYQKLGGGYCLPLPDCEVPRPQLLMAQQLGTVIYAMRSHSRDVAGETVVVLGQGSAGLFFTFLLRRAGAARVIAADLCPARLAVSRQYGADVTIDASNDDVRSAVLDLTDGKGADYVVEAVGRRETFLLTTALARVGGELLWFGLPDSDESIQIDFTQFFRKKLRAASTYGAQDETDARSFRHALGILARGELDVAPLLSHVYSIEEIGEAFRVAHRPADAGALKVSLSFA